MIKGKRLLAVLLTLCMLVFPYVTCFADIINIDVAQLYADETEDEGVVLNITSTTRLKCEGDVMKIKSLNVKAGVTLMFERGTFIIDNFSGTGYIRANANANILFNCANVPSGYVEFDIGEKQKETNVRFAEVGGYQYPITCEENRYGVIVSTDTLIEITEKESADDSCAVKTEYYHVSASAKKASKLDLCNFMGNIEGAAVKLSEPVSIRFGTVVSTDAFAKIDELGYVVALEKECEKHDGQLNLGFQQKVDAIAYNAQTAKPDIRLEDAVAFTVVLQGIPEYAYDENIVTKTYAKVTVGGKQYTVYGEPVTLGLYHAAKAFDKSELSEEQIEDVEALIAKTENGIAAEVEIWDGGKCGDNLNWALVSDGTLYIFGSGEMYDYVKYFTPAPWYIYRNEPYISEDGKTILNPDGSRYRDIGDYYIANPNNYRIKRVVVDEGVTYLGNWAFYRICVDELAIPEGVEKTGHFCFRYSPNLKKLTLPDSLKILGDYGISRNQVLTDVNFGKGLEHLGFAACQNNPYLARAILPDTVISMGDQQNPAYVGGDVGYSNVGVFENCTRLSEITFGSVKTVPQRVCMSTAVTSVEIPASAESVEEYAFYHCASLESVSFEENSACRTIGHHAFAQCEKLTRVTGAKSLETIGEGAFTASKALEVFDFSDTNKSFADKLFMSTALKECRLGENMTVMPSLLLEVSGVEKLYISKSVVRFGDLSIYGCTGLTDIYYDGTRTDWDSITKASGWAGGGTAEICTVHFKDGKTELLKNCLA